MTLNRPVLLLSVVLSLAACGQPCRQTERSSVAEDGVCLLIEAYAHLVQSAASYNGPKDDQSLVALARTKLDYISEFRVIRFGKYVFVISEFDRAQGDSVRLFGDALILNTQAGSYIFLQMSKS